jgi:hypothetical protein
MGAGAPEGLEALRPRSLHPKWTVACRGVTLRHERFAAKRRLPGVGIQWFPKRRAAREPVVLIGDPRLEDWETVSTFEDQTTALAWRDQLRGMGLDAQCAADHPLDRFGRGDIYLVVPPEQWSRANEIIDNLD